jgi:hypothetical protein
VSGESSEQVARRCLKLIFPVFSTLAFSLLLARREETRW